MVTSTSIPGAETVQQITQITPVDVTGLRDPGMRALVLLAASLGWNVIQKVNNPVALVARDGTQRRLPTNTSIRMSVFQAALSTIMVHTEGREATPELIDAIAATVKLDRDHERRLRLAIGESTDDHRQRLQHEKAAELKREPDEHLTQRIEMPKLVESLQYSEGPHDGQNHGALVSREKFKAHHTSSSGRTATYESDSSYERIWEDGYKDYECQVCGKVYKSPKGAGSHRQFHYRTGEADDSTTPAWRRSLNRGVPTEWEERPERQPPAAEDLVFEEPPDEDRGRTHYVGDGCEPFHEEPDMLFGSTPGFGEPDDRTRDYDVMSTLTASAEEVIDRIAEMVAPRIFEQRDTWKRIAEEHAETIDSLQNELGDTKAELQKVQANWEALKGLING